MPISNMQQARQMYNQGGLSALQDPRQNYGFGSFVKKAVRGVKKIAKSPLGKMAIAGAIGFGIPGTNFGGLMGRGTGSMFGQANGMFGNTGGISGLFSKFGGNAVSKGMNIHGPKQGILSKMGGGIKNIYGGMSTGEKLFAGASAAAIGAPLLMGGKPEEVVDEVVEQVDPKAAVQSAKNYYSGLGDKGLGLNFQPKKKYVDEIFYNTQGAADGGRIGYAIGGDVDEEEEIIRQQAGQIMIPRQTYLNMGGGAGDAQAEQMLMAEYTKYKQQGGDLSFEQFVQAVMQQQGQAQGAQQMAANGGRMGYAGGGIMDTEEASEMIDMGGQEKDYRETGGFVEMGGEERADDVPARLSKNEFVFTADAVRAAGGGDIDQGSEVMQNMMDNLEQGGEISQGSQGLGGEEMVSEEEMIQEPNGAQEMYDQQQLLQSRMA